MKVTKIKAGEYKGESQGFTFTVSYFALDRDWAYNIQGLKDIINAYGIKKTKKDCIDAVLEVISTDIWERVELAKLLNNNSPSKLKRRIK